MIFRRSRLPAYLIALVVLLLAGTPLRAEEAVQYFGAFREVSPAAIEPQGWLKEMLHRQAEGLARHHAVSGYPYDTCLWAGVMPPSPNPKAKKWWPYEQAGYLVDGLERLGLMSGDRAILGEADASVRYILAHPAADDSLGPTDIGPTNWPHAVVFRALMASYSAKPNPAIPQALRKHYLARPSDYGNARDSANIEAILWTYAQSGDPKLLEIARRTYDNFNHIAPAAPPGSASPASASSPATSLGALLSDDKIIEHGVTFNETAKLPALLYLYTGDPTLLAATVNAYKKIDRDHMLASGMHSANERLDGNDPWKLTETCDVTDYTWTVGYLLMASGDATWADHIEKAIFNAGLGAISKDFKSHQYFSSPNQVIATHGICKVQNPDRLAFRPGHDVECCSGNVHRFLPNFALRQWMTTPQGGVVAALYSPSRFTTTISGATVTIEQQTDYPFSDEVKLILHTTAPVRFPISLRAPGWCAQPTMRVNSETQHTMRPGRFATVDRTFSDGDQIVLRFPMSVTIHKWGADKVSLERGPLVYSLRIAEDAEPVHGVKTSSDFPAWDIRPASPWNYAITLGDSDLAEGVKVLTNPAEGFPWDPGSAPVELQLPATRVQNWTFPDNGGNPRFPVKMNLSGSLETVTLVPYGTTRLRLTVFPLAHADANAPAPQPTK